MARLQNLQELEHVDVFSHSVSLLRELDQLTNLKMLSITLDYNKMEQGNQSHKEMLLSSLHQLETHNLGDLRIKFELANEGNISADSWQCHCLGSLRDLNIHAEGIIKVPEWLTSLNNISLLSLAVKDMDRNDLGVVGHIPNLLHFSLVLRDPNPESSSVIISRSHGFEKLKNFIFSSRRRLLFGYRAMPNVIDVTFFIYTSSCLRSACGIRNLSNLENIGVLLIGQDPSEVRAAGDAFKSAVSVHSNRPTLEIYSWAVIQGEEEEEEEEGRRIRRCISRDWDGN
ncbi:hypothetical protein PR202_ga00612 [Eleusine coracana subsp. coracana]|uniref:Disease resistance R13L4/SHOC-2-like LRR domain-containing protein n=1 Tax=Eleusine coracana subsp. coracana TaxID=191504 RepID=A0AAV5BEB7_ELECO|nr:hypothetical protein PR202_ga00612 [Eleusine coracana subsp. coracana]